MAPYISDDQILGAALDVISEKGYASATTLQIAAAAEVSEITLFRRFGSKKNLLIAAVKNEADRFNVGEIKYTGDLAVDLLYIVDFYQTLVSSRGQFLTMMLTEVRRQPELQEIAQLPLAIVGRICAVIERYQQEGVLVDEPPLSAFVTLVGPLFLGGVFNSVQPELIGSELNPQDHVKRFLKGRAPSL